MTATTTTRVPTQRSRRPAPPAPWSCENCTHTNAGRRWRCADCGTTRL